MDLFWRAMMEAGFGTSRSAAVMYTIMTRYVDDIEGMTADDGDIVEYELRRLLILGR